MSIGIVPSSKLTVLTDEQLERKLDSRTRRRRTDISSWPTDECEQPVLIRSNKVQGAMDKSRKVIHDVEADDVVTPFAPTRQIKKRLRDDESFGDNLSVLLKKA